VAIAIPSNPNHNPTRAISTQATAVSTGHGESTTNSGAKKKPVPTYQEEPARSAFNTKVNQAGIDGPQLPFAVTFTMIPTVRRDGAPRNYPPGNRWEQVSPVRGSVPTGTRVGGPGVPWP